MNVNKKRALVIGANGTIGRAITALMRDDYELHTLSQAETDYSDESLALHRARFTQIGSFDIIICCIGTLHNDSVKPEKRLAQLDEAKLLEYFRINTVLPAMCLKAFASLLSKASDSKFVFLSAMVGSIGDNVLGGWYGYRSSKAALNMMIKTASIELARTHKTAAVAVIHPGTTQGPLSKPFASGVSKDKYYTPEQSAQRILALTESLTANQSGAFFNWDGSVLPW